MRRSIVLLLFMASLLGACSPTVTLLSAQSQPTPTRAAATLPPPLARTPYPTPTRTRSLGISPDALQGVVVTIWHGWDGSSASLLAQMASEFNLSNQWGIRVNVVSQGNLNLLTSAVEKSLPTLDRPDIVVALPEQILVWKEQIIDLAPYVEQPEIGLSLADLPAAFGAQSTVNAVRYGLPAARSARFIFYNRSFAKDLGFATAPQTADEFRKQACAANAFWKQDADLTNDGFGGMALDVDDNWQSPYAWLVAGGGEVFSAGEFHFNTPGNVAALEYFSKLREDNCAWLPDTASNFEHLASRRALFITGSLGEIAEQNAAFSAAVSSDRWTLLPFPGKAPVIAAYGLDYAVIKSNDARQLAAWLFMRWMLEAKNQANWSRGTGLLPVTTPAINLLKTDTTTIPQWAAALDLIPDAKAYPQTDQWLLADKVLADGFIAYSRSFPYLTTADVFDLMDATIQDLFKK